MTIKLHVGDASHVSATQYFDQHIGQANQVFASPTGALTEANPLLQRPELNAGPLNRAALIEQLPHAAAARTPEPNAWVAMLKNVGAKINRMDPAQINAYYARNPTHHPDHPEQIAARNGLELTWAGADAAVTAGTLMSGFGILKLFGGTLRHKALRADIGLARQALTGKLFNYANTEKEILSVIQQTAAKRSEAVVRIPKINDELATIRQSLFSHPKTSPTYTQLIDRQTALQQELKWLTDDVARMTTNTAQTANKKLDEIGSTLRVQDDLSVAAIPDEVLKARVSHLLQTRHPNEWKAAAKGDPQAAQRLKELEYVVGVTPQNVAHKENLALAALKTAREKATADNNELTQASIQQYGKRLNGEAHATDDTVNALRTQWESSLSEVHAIEAGLKMLRDYRATIEATSARTQPWIF